MIVLLTSGGTWLDMVVIVALPCCTAQEELRPQSIVHIQHVSWKSCPVAFQSFNMWVDQKQRMDEQAR